MKTLTIFVLLFGIMLSTNKSFAQDEPEFKEYGIISGYVEYQISGCRTGLGQFYFEEYGKYAARYLQGQDECQGSVNKINEAGIWVPEGTYRIKLDQSIGIKTPPFDNSKRINLYKISGGDFDKAFTSYMKADGYIQKGNETVLDKDCVVWETEKNDPKIIASIWKGVKLKIIQTNADGSTYIQVAIKFVEEEPIPFFRFEPPSGIKWEVTK
jgi:hypothetical protein